MLYYTDNNAIVGIMYYTRRWGGDVMLTSLLNKELEQMGYKMSIHRMLDKLKEAQQVISVFASSKGSPVARAAYSRFEGVTKEYADKYDLLKYLN